MDEQCVVFPTHQSSVGRGRLEVAAKLYQFFEVVQTQCLLLLSREHLASSLHCTLRKLERCLKL